MIMENLLPKTLAKQEAWRQSDLKPLLRPSWVRYHSDHAQRDSGMKLAPNAVTLLNGSVLGKDKASLNLEAGIMLEQDQPLIELEQSHGLNFAFKQLYQTGIRIRVKAGFKALNPLVIQQLWQAIGENALAIASQLEIIVEAGASLTLYDQSSSTQNNDFWVMPSYHIRLESGAELNLHRFSNLSPKLVMTAITHVEMAENSKLEIGCLTLDQGFSRNELIIKMRGEHANLTLNGAYIANGDSRIEHAITLHHLAPNCVSSQIFHGIADDTAQANFQAKIIVAKGADGTDGKQSHKALLLSNQASIYAKPALEIYADEVKCAHGATIGDIDPMQLFYLRARGINEALARSLLIQGFLTSPLESLSSHSLLSLLEQELGQGKDKIGDVL